MKYLAGRGPSWLAHRDAGLAGTSVRRRYHAVPPRAAPIADARRHHVDRGASHGGIIEPDEPADPGSISRHPAIARDDAAGLHDAQERLDVDPAAVGAGAHDVTRVAGRRERQRVHAHDAAGGGLVDDARGLVREPRGRGSWLPRTREPLRRVPRAHADLDAERARRRARVRDHAVVVDARAVTDARRHGLDGGDGDAERVADTERADAGGVLADASGVRDEGANSERQRQAERELAGERPGDQDVAELHTALALRDGVEDDDARDHGGAAL